MRTATDASTHKQLAEDLRINAELLWVWFTLEPPITEAILGEELQIALPGFLIVYDRPYSWELINEVALAILYDVESELTDRKERMGEAILNDVESKLTWMRELHR